jgi:hypothetical protein
MATSITSIKCVLTHRESLENKHRPISSGAVTLKTIADSPQVLGGDDRGSVLKDGHKIGEATVRKVKEARTVCCANLDG